jgi:hypothetical protein
MGRCGLTIFLSKMRYMQIVKYPDEPNLCRKMSNSASRGEKLYYPHWV